MFALRFILALFLGILARETLADLYRWVDPETGSVKFSSYPPPWFGDEALEKGAPKVEHIPPRKPGAVGEPQSDTPRSPLEALDDRRKRVMQQITALPAQADFQRSGAGLKQHLDAYAAVTAEMDRLDPKGADRRRAEAQPFLDKLVEGMRALVKPPAPPVK